MNWAMKIWKLVNTVFHRVQEKNSHLFKTEMDGHETALCCHTHIYLSNGTLQIQILLVRTAQLVSYICQVIIQVSPTKTYMYYSDSDDVISPTTSIFIGQLSRILTKNLKFKAPISKIYVCMLTQCDFIHLHLY